MTTEMTIHTPNAMPALCRSMDDYMALSSMLARSQFVPKDFRGNEGDVLAAVLFGRSLGLDPMQALQSIAVVNGKPSIYGDTALAVVRASGLVTSVQETIEGEGDKTVAVCKVTRANGDVVEQRYTVDDAKKAGLWGKSGPWQQYPKRMLQMRARGFALRDAAPDALRGLITREEAQDYQPEPMKNITPRQEAPPAAQEPAAVWYYTLKGEGGEVKLETNSMAQIIEAVSRFTWTNETIDANWDMVHNLRDDIGRQVEDRRKAGQSTTKFEAALRQVSEIIDSMKAVSSLIDSVQNREPNLVDA